MGHFLRFLFLIFLLLFFVKISYSQISNSAIILKDDNPTLQKHLENLANLNVTSDIDTIEVILIEYLVGQGYLKAIIDSIITIDATTNVFINADSQHFFKIKEHTLPESFMRRNEGKGIEVDKAYEFYKLEKLEKRVISYFENNGFPFASISKNDITFNQDTIEFHWNLEKGQRFIIEEVDISGDVNLSQGYLAGISRIRLNSLYSEEKIKNAGRKLSELEFASLSAPPKVLFTPSGAKVSFPMERLRANRFDGIAGLMSVPTGDNETQYRISGQMNLFLLNSLGYGEIIDLKWRAPGEGSQQLNITTSFPYILGTPVGAGYDFFMNKQDSSFILVKQRPSLSFSGYGRLSFSTFVIIETNSVFQTSPNEDPLRMTSANYKKTMYGAEVVLKSGITNHSYNRGWKIRSALAAGNRAITGTQISDIPSNTTQYISESTIKYHLPFGNQSLANISIDANLQTGEKLLYNELHRIGGFSTLKGFDEGSLLASSYMIITTEYRLYIAEDTFVSMLANAAWVENKSIAGYSNDFPIGLAVGLNFKTKPGILSIFYGLGKQKNQELQFRNAKIHIGFVSLF